MSRTRPPVVAGLVPRAGTSTLAAALHARDTGLLGAGEGRGRRADVLVCTSEEGALQRAGAVALPARGVRPVLAVTVDPAAPVPVAVVERLRARFSAVVLLPHVGRWQGGAPAAEAAAVLAHPPGLLPAALAVYAEALRELVTAVVRCGLLDRDAPPPAGDHRRVELWRGLRSVERSGAARPGTAAERSPHIRLVPATPARTRAGAVVDELDDDAIEADQAPGPAPRVLTAAGRAG